MDERSYPPIAIVPIGKQDRVNIDDMILNDTVMLTLRAQFKFILWSNSKRRRFDTNQHEALLDPPVKSMLNDV